MLDDIPFEVVHTVLQYISASDIAAVRLVATRLKVLHIQIISARGISLTQDAVDCFPQFKLLLVVHSLDSQALPKITNQQLDRFYSARWVLRVDALTRREILDCVTKTQCHRVSSAARCGSS